MQQLNFIRSVHGISGEMESHLRASNVDLRLSFGSCASTRGGSTLVSDKQQVCFGFGEKRSRMQQGRAFAAGGVKAQTEEKEMQKETKLWGGRFEKGVTPAVEKFGQSVSYDWKLYKHDLMGSRAHASMLAKQVWNRYASLRERIFC